VLRRINSTGITGEGKSRWEEQAKPGSPRK